MTDEYSVHASHSEDMFTCLYPTDLISCQSEYPIYADVATGMPTRRQIHRALRRLAQTIIEVHDSYECTKANITIMSMRNASLGFAYAMRPSLLTRVSVLDRTSALHFLTASFGPCAHNNHLIVAASSFEGLLLLGTILPYYHHLCHRNWIFAKHVVPGG